MNKKTLLVSQHTNLHSWYKSLFEEIGLTDVHTTDKNKDGLNMLIREIKPKRIYIASNFYSIATPYMVGLLHEKWEGKKIDINVFNIDEFPDELAIWFIFHGAVSYIDLTSGIDEFKNGIKRSLTATKFNEYMSPAVKYIYDGMDGRPDCKLNINDMQKEILIMLSNACTQKEMMNNLHISRTTLYSYIRDTEKIFHVHSTLELVKVAHVLGIVNKKHLVFNKVNNPRKYLTDYGKTQKEINRRAAKKQTSVSVS